MNFNLKDEAEKPALPGPLGKLTLLDPYFAVDKYYYDNTYAGPQSEGWIDPKSEKAARLLSYSRKFMLRGDWVLPRLLLEKGFGGIYSTLLMIPKVEAEYYKTLLIDVAAFERDNYLLKGGAVLGADLVAWPCTTASCSSCRALTGPAGEATTGGPST